MCLVVWERKGKITVAVVEVYAKQLSFFASRGPAISGNCDVMTEMNDGSATSMTTETRSRGGVLERVDLCMDTCQWHTEPMV